MHSNHICCIFGLLQACLRKWLEKRMWEFSIWRFSFLRKYILPQGYLSSTPIYMANFKPTSMSDFIVHFKGLDKSPCPVSTKRSRRIIISRVLGSSAWWYFSLQMFKHPSFDVKFPESKFGVKGPLQKGSYQKSWIWWGWKAIHKNQNGKIVSWALMSPLK